MALGSKSNGDGDSVTFTANDTQTHTGTTTAEQHLLKKAGKLFNNLLHHQIEVNKNKFGREKFQPDSFKLNKSIEEIDPLLWNFLTIATTSVRERSGKPSTSNKQIKRFFILCQSIHCTNQQFFSPLHYILANLVDMYGGAKKLNSLLNRLGVICSNDTQDRVVTEIAEYERNRQISESLTPNVLTVASVDDVDILKPHAAVYCGDQGRSFHGTTIQIVQPQPNNKITLFTPPTCVNSESASTGISNSLFTLDLSCSNSETSVFSETNRYCILQKAFNSNCSHWYKNSRAII